MAFEKSKVLKSAEKFVAAGKIPQAVEEYQKILKENPKDWNLMIQIGDLMLKISRAPEAIEHFQRVADHYYSDGFFLKAIAIYKRINKLDPSLTDICMKLADLYLKQGLTMDAKSQLQVVAHHYLSKNENKEAIQTLQKLIEIEPDNLRTRNELAKAYKTENMIPEAIQEYLEISDQLTRKNLLKESTAVLETAYKLDPNNTDVLNKILAIYSEQNEAAKGIALIEEALKAEPANPDLLRLLAESYQSRNEFHKAHESVDRAIGNASQKDPLWELKGDIYLKAGDIENAFSQYSLIVEKEIQRKDIDNSLNVLEKITHADSSFYPAWRKLVDLYTMLRQNANLLSAYANLTDAYITKKMYRDAEGCLEKLISLDPEDSQHQEKLKFVRSFLEKPTTPPKPPVKEKEYEVEISEEIRRPQFVGMTPETLPGVPSFEREAAKIPARTVSQPATAPSAPVQPAAAKVHATPVVANVAEEEKAFVSEHLIEAEVFNKYGLIDKAIEQLQMIIGKYPGATSARQKLKEIYLEKGDRDKAVDECITMSRIFRKQGEMDLVEDLLSEARQINPNHSALEKAYSELPEVSKEPSIISEAGTPATKPAPQPVIPKHVPPREKAPAQKVPTPSLKTLTSAPAKGTATKHAKEMPTPAKGADVLGELERLAQSIKTQSGSFKIKPAPPPASTATKPKTAPASPAPAPPPLPRLEEEVPEIEIEIDEPVMESAAPALPSALPDRAFEEFEFFLDQGLHKEAERILESIREKHPTDPGVLRRSEKLRQAPPPIPQEPAKAAEPAKSFEEEISIDLDEAFLVPPEIEPPVSEVTGEPEVSIAGDEIALNLDESSAQSSEAVAEDVHPVVEAQATPQETARASSEAEPSIDLDEFAINIEDVGEPLIPVVEDASKVEEAALNASANEETRFLEFAELEDNADVAAAAGREEDISLEQSLSDAVDAVFQAHDEVLPQVAEKEEPEEQETKTAHVKEELFEEEDDFFDLAAELEEGLLNVQSAVEDERPPDGQNYSIEEILTDFKKGVEKQLSTEDYDTRYNLGIAYKEMGLIDEAIAEFQIAAKDPKRFLECCSMLGLCFVEKGMHKLAIKWYQRGLDTSGYSEEEYQGLRFELAQAHESLGEIQKAIEVYQDVYGVNANYRNVSKKVKELQEVLKKK